MKVLNLRCAHEHAFEGWFDSEADYQSQRDGGLLACPLCADQTIMRLPSAPRLNLSLSKDRGFVDAQEVASAPSVSPAPDAAALQALWLEAVQHVITKTDDVGERFSEEARRIHYGEIPERAIRGQASAKEAIALREEGIEVMALPMPVMPKGTLQ
jgi:hypothetical protein